MTDVLTRLHTHADGTFAFERWQDCEDIIERNKRLATEHQRAETFHHIGTIPNVIFEKFMRDKGMNMLAMSSEEFGQVIKRILRDPDYAYLRTTDRKF